MLVRSFLYHGGTDIYKKVQAESFKHGFFSPSLKAFFKYYHELLYNKSTTGELTNGKFFL